MLFLAVLETLKKEQELATIVINYDVFAEEERVTIEILYVKRVEVVKLRY